MIFELIIYGPMQCPADVAQALQQVALKIADMPMTPGTEGVITQGQFLIGEWGFVEK